MNGVRTAARPPLRLAAVGDVMLARDVGRHFAAAPADFGMDDIRRILSGAHVVLANLEAPIAIGGTPDPVQDPHVTFRAPPSTIEVLLGLGVTAVSLGNNHALDYGATALIETIARLDAAGIRHVGAGRNYEAACAPLLLEVAGRRLAILSYSATYSANTRMATRTRPGVADHRLDRLLPRISELAAGGHDVIVTPHWGYEYRRCPLPFQMRDARRMVDAGALLVIGHGPHHIQGVEVHRGRDIVYSLGNFIFDEPFPLARHGIIYIAELRGSEPSRRTIVPIRIVDHVPRVLDGPARGRILGLVDRLGLSYRTANPRESARLSTDYLIELTGRVRRTRSLKYLRVPPRSFYRDVSPRLLMAATARRLRGMLVH